MPDIHHRLTMSGPRDEVFVGLTQMVRARAVEVGARAQVLVLDRERRAVWRIVAGPADWVGTEVSFELEDAGAETLVSFAHRHWREATPAMAACTTRWAKGLFALERAVAIREPDDTRL